MAIPFLDIFAIGERILDKIIPDPQQKLQAQLELAKLQQQGEFKDLEFQAQMAKGQTDINLEEAKSEKWWKAGWRPFIGWVCGLGFLYQVFLAPIWTWYFGNVAGWDALPRIDNETLNTTLYGILGLGIMRTADKGAVLLKK
jgi:hypothetical protein